MQKRSLILLVVGVVIALGTALSLSKRMHGASGPAVTQVMVAATDIPAGVFIRSDYHLAFTDWPQNNITDSMLTSANSKRSDFDGSVARRAISKGEPIVRTLLVKSNEGGFMSAVLDPGKRAISIAVDSTTGNAGFIFPGDHVDLILSHTVNNNSQQIRASETFIEDVRVLAVDQSLDNPENKAMIAKTLTLEVSPKQAEEINVAKDLGKISVSLRSLATKPNTEDAAAAATNEPPPTSFDDVLKSSSTMPDNETTTVTRDTDVSKIISPGGGAATRVRLLRGKESQEIDFNPDVTTPPPAGGPVAPR